VGGASAPPFCVQEEGTTPVPALPLGHRKDWGMMVGQRKLAV